MKPALQPLASSALTTAEIALFNERGYHLHGKLFSDEDVAAINAAADRVIAGTYDKGSPPDVTTLRIDALLRSLEPA